MHLLQEAKALRTTLDQQKQELEKAELFPEGPDTEVSKLKQTLLQYYNQLKEDEEENTRCSSSLSGKMLCRTIPRCVALLKYAERRGVDMV